MDQSPVRAELKGVPPFGPGNIIDEVVYGNIGENCAGNSDRIVQAAETIEILIVEASISQALADEGVTEIVDQIVTDNPGISARNALAIVGEDVIGGKTWKLPSTQSS